MTYPRERNPNWKGGRTIASNGYVLIKDAENPNADIRGYVYEHRLVAQKILGRPLIDGEIIHHKDRDKRNNSPDNIEILTRIQDHRFLHRKRKDLRKPGQENPLIYCECGCGQRLYKFDTSNRPRHFVSGHNMKGNINGKNQH